MLDLTERKTTQLFGVGSTASSVDIDPSGRRLAVSSMHEELVRLFDLKTGEPPIEIDCSRAVCSVQFSPDGTRLGVVGYDNLIYLCDAKSGHRLITLNGQSRKSERVGFSPKVIFSPDGRRIATNALDRRITVWEAEPAQRRRPEMETPTLAQ